MENSQIIFVLLILTCNTCLALECYKCTEESYNRGACITQLETCKEGEDACATEVIWKATPSWVRRYYITKSCLSKRDCEHEKLLASPECTYNNLDNWRCIDCCSTDKCNYNITLRGNSERSNMLLILSSAATAIALQDVLK